MALSRPRTTRRLLRGSALGLGLLVAGGITAPAAFAIEDTDGPAEQPAELDGTPVPLQDTPEDTPENTGLAAPLSGHFGTGKDFTVQVAPSGAVPGDLDLSGAVFQAMPSAGGPSGTCTTDVDGACTFSAPMNWDWGWLTVDRAIPDVLTAQGSDAVVPAGGYTLTQIQASPGLAAATGSTTFSLCSFPFGCDEGEATSLTETAHNDSLFRTELVTTVTDSASGDPVACAGYELTGPDYPHDAVGAPEPGHADPVPAECLPATTTAAPSTTSSPATTSAPGTSSTAPSSSDDAGTTTDTTDATDTSFPAADPTDADPSTDPVPLARHGFAREDDDPVSFGAGVSDGTGRLVFHGWFLPAEGYLLTPTTMPAGYTPDAADAFGIVTTAREAADGTPAQVTRSVSGPLASVAPAPIPGGGIASAAPTTTTAAAVPTAAPAAAAPALATTGTPVETMALLGGGLVVLGAGALGTSTVLRRRARQRV